MKGLKPFNHLFDRLAVHLNFFLEVFLIVIQGIQKLLLHSIYTIKQSGALAAHCVHQTLLAFDDAADRLEGLFQCLSFSIQASNGGSNGASSGLHIVDECGNVCVNAFGRLRKRIDRRL
ncbi:hypothetical protein D3C73_627230 [compost metagenome]